MKRKEKKKKGTSERQKSRKTEIYRKVARRTEHVAAVSLSSGSFGRIDTPRLFPVHPVLLLLFSAFLRPPPLPAFLTLCVPNCVRDGRPIEKPVRVHESPRASLTCKTRPKQEVSSFLHEYILTNHFYNGGPISFSYSKSVTCGQFFKSIRPPVNTSEL